MLATVEMIKSDNRDVGETFPTLFFEAFSRAKKKEEKKVVDY